jgi:hypothetical protein
MGTQSILIKSQESYAEDFKDKLLKYSDNMYNYKHFFIGESLDRDKLLHAMTFNRLLSSESCTLSKYISNSILGNLDCKFFYQEVIAYPDPEVIVQLGCTWGAIEW